MIPKRIMTTWICDPERDGYSETHRALFARCLTSWLRLMPDYSVTIITLGNLFELGRDAWLEARVAEGNFIGASQWARYVWLRDYGGVYLDMDVEAIQRFDSMLDARVVMGHIGNGMPYANNAVMAAEPGHPFVEELLSWLPRTDHTNPEFGNITGPFMLTAMLKQLGWSGLDEDAVVRGLTVRSSKVFHPYPWTQPYSTDCLRPETLAVHHWGESWKPHAGLPTVTDDYKAVLRA